MSEAQREAFEAWAIEQPRVAAEEDCFARSPYGDKSYEYGQVQSLWLAWQAALLRSQQAGQDERKARHLAIVEQIERACKDLPVGWRLDVDLELHAGSVYLYDADGEQVLITTDGDHSFDEVISININAAIARATPPQGASDEG